MAGLLFDSIECSSPQYVSLDAAGPTAAFGRRVPAGEDITRWLELAVGPENATIWQTNERGSTVLVNCTLVSQGTAGSRQLKLALKQPQTASPGKSTN